MGGQFVVELREWAAVVTNLPSNPLFVHTALNLRRERARLPWWRRGWLLVLLGAGIVVGLYVLWIYTLDAQMRAQGAGYTYTNPPWVTAMMVASGAVMAVLQIWLLVGLFDAVRRALQLCSRTTSSQEYDDLLLLSRLSSKEILLGFTGGSILSVLRIALLGIGFGFALRGISILVEPYMDSPNFGLSYLPPTWLDPAYFFARTAGTSDFNWMVTMLATANDSLFSLVALPVTLVFAALHTLASISAIVLVAVIVGQGLGSTARFAYAGVLTLVQLVYMFSGGMAGILASGSVEALKQTTVIVLIALPILSLLLWLARTPPIAAGVGTLLLTAVLLPTLWSAAVTFLAQPLLSGGWDVFGLNPSALYEGLSWLYLNRYWNQGWPSPYAYAYFPGQRYDTNISLDFIAELLVLVYSLTMAVMALIFAKRAIEQRGRAV